MINGQLTPETEPYLPNAGLDDELQNAITAVFEDETLMGANNWMMRDWMDEWPIYTWSTCNQIVEILLRFWKACTTRDFIPVRCASTHAVICWATFSITT